MTTIKHESRSRSMWLSHDDNGETDNTLAFFGMSLVQHTHGKHHASTLISTPTGFRLHEITTHNVHGGAIITLTDGTNLVNIGINGISPESLCDGISAAQL